MKDSILKGVGFGITSGTITTLGLMIGLFASTNSKIIVIGGILSIAIADAFSDALGIHISEEASKKTSHKEVWESTITTFLCKFIFASIFIIPILLLQLQTAIIISIIIGFLMISLFSYFIAKRNKENCISVVSEHLIIAVIVIILTYLVGKGINHLIL